jgi:hypothetical protein
MSSGEGRKTLTLFGSSRTYVEFQTVDKIKKPSDSENISD